MSGRARTPRVDAIQSECPKGGSRKYRRSPALHSLIHPPAGRTGGSSMTYVGRLPRPPPKIGTGRSTRCAAAWTASSSPPLGRTRPGAGRPGSARQGGLRRLSGHRAVPGSRVGRAGAIRCLGWADRGGAIAPAAQVPARPAATRGSARTHPGDGPNTGIAISREVLQRGTERVSCICWPP